MTDLSRQDVLSTDNDNMVEPTSEELEQVQDLLSNLPEEMLLNALAEKGELENGSFIKVVQRAVAQKYSGPLPPPKMLHDYDMVSSGFADRIVSMAEKEQSHRHALEVKAVDGAVEKDKRSQRYALFTIFFLSLICAGLIYSGHDIAGTVLGGTTLVGLVALFITGKRHKKDNTENSEPPEDFQQPE